MLPSELILERFRQNSARDIDLTLRPAYHALLARLGDPHKKVPPVFHVAGTNGKGSTCAFLRAMLEAAGYRVHVYTSPHLVRFHERIRVAGNLIEEGELATILEECERVADPGGVTYFEAATAAAFTAFARNSADFTILETGLGGRLDATNIIEKPLATVITRLSFDHREYLGTTMAQIAREKAGIMRRDVPCFSARQSDADSLTTLREAAQKIGASLYVGGEAWRVEETSSGFHFTNPTCEDDFPPPKLVGRHQYDNAGLAIAALSALPVMIPRAAIIGGLQKVEWPARLQKIECGVLPGLLPPGCELWLDGGHNDSAGEVLAKQMQMWSEVDSRPLHVVCGMLTTKRPEEFLSPLKPFITNLCAVAIPDEPLSFSASEFAACAWACGFVRVSVAEDVTQAFSQIVFEKEKPARVLICGSLYLAGHVLRINNP